MSSAQGSARQVREAVDAAMVVDRAGWSGAARSAEVVELLAARERLDALVHAAVGEWDRDAAWALDGSVSPVAWLAHRTPVTRQDAATLVRSARHVARHEVTAKALGAGDISVAHVQVAARAVKHREDLYEQHEDVLLDAARALDPSAFRAAMAHWRRCADAVDDHDRAVKEITGSYLDIVSTFEGVGHLDGRLDAVSTATLVRVLDRMEPPDGFDGIAAPRTRAQRRADALVRLASGERPPPINLDITVDIDTLAGRPSPDLEHGCCEIAGSGPVSPAVAAMLACDAAIGRVMMRGRSEVLDVGRQTRMLNRAQRRALGIRDGGCVEPGCTAPAEWCDAHHIVHWTAHGPTNLANLELRCRRHHILQHQRDLQAALARRQE